ncbi:MAG: hypothetical protein NTU83_07735 [Candidatus Hydrogenedentes bacterium]|nr:hypothetical protein [Candidatus Hydrogenedentota bacterium]
MRQPVVADSAAQPEVAEHPRDDDPARGAPHADPAEVAFRVGDVVQRDGVGESEGRREEQAVDAVHREERHEARLLRQRDHCDRRDQVAQAEQAFGTDVAVGDVRHQKRREESRQCGHGEDFADLICRKMQMGFQIQAQYRYGRAGHEVFEKHHEGKSELQRTRH